MKMVFVETTGFHQIELARLQQRVVRLWMMIQSRSLWTSLLFCCPQSSGSLEFSFSGWDECELQLMVHQREALDVW